MSLLSFLHAPCLTCVSYNPPEEEVSRTDKSKRVSSHRYSEIVFIVLMSFKKKMLIDTSLLMTACK